MNRWQVYVEDLLKWGRIGKRLYVFFGDPFSPDGQWSIMKDAVFETKEHKNFALDSDAFLDDSRISSGLCPSYDVRGFLQAMSDAAWDIGIKPKQLEDNRNELKAVREHLADMRKLAKVSE